jgi:flagellin-like hook-associated protein FlgL
MFDVYGLIDKEKRKMKSIHLTAGIRVNLLSLQRTAGNINRVQQRLSTGRKINTAMDDPVHFFAACDHLQRANDLSQVKDGVLEAIQIIKAAEKGIEAIERLIDSAESIALSALSSGTDDDRNELIRQYNGILDQIDTLASDAGYNGASLLNSDAETVTVVFNETGESQLTVTGFDASSQGLGIQRVWESGGQAGIQSDEVHDGSSAAWVGIVDVNHDNTNDYSGESSTVGTANNYLEGVIDVTGMDELVLWYNYTTWDYPGHDEPGFQLLINDQVELSYDAKDISPTNDNDMDSTGWQKFTYDLSGYAGSTLKLTVYAGNSDDLSHQSWAYIEAPNAWGGGAARPGIWQSEAEISTSLQQIDQAKSTLRANAVRMASSLSIITTRSDFTEKMVQTLSEGADSLLNADMNAESANMLMLQTRQLLGTRSLSMASRASQDVLRLF